MIPLPGAVLYPSRIVRREAFPWGEGVKGDGRREDGSHKVVCIKMSSCRVRETAKLRGNGDILKSSFWGGANENILLEII